MKRTNELDIAPGMKLDADYIAGASIALLGKRGAGKSYAARVLAESLFDAGVQTVIVDPMGVFWGLRAGADGGKGGIPIPVFGGDHGDAPLESSAGALMADLVVEERLSMILDLSGFGSRTQERSFAAAFLDRLYRTNKDLVHLIVDEADLLAPQKPRREDAHLLVTMENIVRRGRNRGIGITMATQRAAVLNKDVLTQVDGLVALRVAAPQDRDAIRDWVRGQGDEATWQEIAPSLPGLANGESWWWIPEKKILERVQIRRTRTFDSSPTRKRGQSATAPKVLADVDLDAIGARIAATIERAKATDPRELTRKIRQLEKALATQTKDTPTPEPVIIETPAIDEKLVARLEAAVAMFVDAQKRSDEQASALADVMRASADDAQNRSREIAETVSSITAALRSGKAELPARHRQSAPTVTEAVTRRATPPASNPVTVKTPAPDQSISPARMKLLKAAAALEGVGFEMAGKLQLALWAGVSPKSSGYANNLGALRTMGLIDYPAPSHVCLTDEGRSAVGRVVPIVSDEELHRKVQSLVSPARWRILAALIDSYPDPMSRDDLAEAAGVSAASSGFANNLGALRSLGLLDYPASGMTSATSALFLNGRG